MTRIVTWLLSTLTVLVLLLGYHTSTSGALSTTGSAVLSQQPVGSGSGGRSGATAAGSQTVTGPTVQTQWGPVQVEIVVTDGTITDVSVLQYPSGNSQDQQINQYALPVLIRETLDAQSADIDMVSGATVTSTGYLGSLQAALDQAGL